MSTATSTSLFITVIKCALMIAALDDYQTIDVRGEEFNIKYVGYSFYPHLRLAIPLYPCHDIRL